MSLVVRMVSRIEYIYFTFINVPEIYVCSLRKTKSTAPDTRILACKIANITYEENWHREIMLLEVYDRVSIRHRSIISKHHLTGYGKCVTVEQLLFIYS